MSILEALAHDHRALEACIAQLATTPHTEPTQRRRLFAQLQSQLVAHARAEEVVVYQALRERLPQDASTLEALEEHHVADLLLQELAADCPGGLRWSAKLRVLEETLRHHIKEEEITLFAVIEQQFDDDTRLRMGLEFAALKHERIEAMLAPLRRALPSFAGRALVTPQVMVGRLFRRGELLLRRRFTRRRVLLTDADVDPASRAR